MESMPIILSTPSAHEDDHSSGIVLFSSFILRDKLNRQLLWIALGATIIQFIMFKFLYPFADYFSDSYSYLYAAYARLEINIWPIGYSKFLYAYHQLTHSDTALVGFQYFFLEAACLYFFYTILYFCRPGKNIIYIFFAFLFFNPLFLYLSNYVNSDPLFAALSLLWFTELIWIIRRPRLYLIFTQGILLFLCFTVRNNAYYYPFITLIAFALSRQRLLFKVVGTLAGLILIIPFILHTRALAKQTTGTAQFSLFTGWQLANNALYMYGHIQVDNADLPTEGTKELDRMSRDFYNKVGPDFDNYLFFYVANFFIRQPESPLKQYFSKYYQIKHNRDLPVAWGKASVTFDQYGKYLIKHYPFEFARYFLLTNTKNYFFPPLEKLEVYNLGRSDIDPIAKYWFDYKSSKVAAFSKEFQQNILWIFPGLFFGVNVYFLFALIRGIRTKRLPGMDNIFKHTLLLTSAFFLANFGFSVFTSMIVLRYQVFPMIILFTYALLLFELQRWGANATDRIPAVETRALSENAKIPTL